MSEQKRIGKQLDAVFQAFYTTKSSGMGIGLSVSRSIIEKPFFIPRDPARTTDAAGVMRTS